VYIHLYNRNFAKISTFGEITEALKRRRETSRRREETSGRREEAGF